MYINTDRKKIPFMICMGKKKKKKQLGQAQSAQSFINCFVLNTEITYND